MTRAARDDVWQAAGASKGTTLCLDCLEHRLGRTLLAADERPRRSPLFPR
jgi:hypothetical protein